MAYGPVVRKQEKKKDQETRVGEKSIIITVVLVEGSSTHLGRKEILESRPKMAAVLKLPVIDLSAVDKLSTVDSIRQACTEVGFFYVINHGVDKDIIEKLFCQSKNFFSLPLEEKLKLERKVQTGYTPFYSEKLDPLSNHGGDCKETFYIGPFDDDAQSCLNQWPSEATLPAWRETIEAYYKQVLLAGKRLLSLVALSLDLDENFFAQPNPFLRLLHYPGELVSSNGEIFGSSAHSDYGMITLLATDGVPGLQVCREKDCQPRMWEEVPHVDGAFLVNIGDTLERWTNCRYRSTLHRVMLTGQKRYSVAFFLDGNSECVVECLESCCSESCPPKFPPIRCGEYVEQCMRASYI